jgi:hypothetical protein
MIFPTYVISALLIVKIVKKYKNVSINMSFIRTTKQDGLQVHCERVKTAQGLQYNIQL